MSHVIYNGRETKCRHCHKVFEKGEVVWVDKTTAVIVICEQDPEKPCGATHVDPYRHRSWAPAFFREKPKSSV